MHIKGNNMDFENWPNSDLEFELTLDRTKNDELRKSLIINEIQKRKANSLEDELIKEKSNSPLKRSIKHILGTTVGIFAVFIVVVIYNMPSISGYNIHAPLLITQLLKTLPSGEVNNLKPLMPSSSWKDVNKPEIKEQLKIYKSLGDYVSHSDPIQQKVATTSGTKHISVALYHTTAEFKNGRADIFINIGKYSENDFKIIVFNVTTSDAY
jgi:hypothetical protein